MILYVIAFKWLHYTGFLISQAMCFQNNPRFNEVANGLFYTFNDYKFGRYDLRRNLPVSG